MARKIIRLVAFIEMLIGGLTILGLTGFEVLSLSKKSPNVLIFVFLSAALSSSIGIGLYMYKHWARKLLVFFSGYVIITKIMIFGGLFRFEGEILTFIPANFKDATSIIYHCFLVIFFTRSPIKEFFNINGTQTYKHVSRDTVKKSSAETAAELFEPVKTRLLILFLVFAVSLVYMNAVFGKFVWDDQTIVVRNEAIKSFGNIAYIFSHDFAKMTNYNGNIYRPMQELSYMWDCFLWGMYPAGFHLTNILLHIGCVLLLFYIVLPVSGSKSVAFFSSLIFGLHPINTEAVTYISGRSDSLFLFFMLASLLLYIKEGGHKNIIIKTGCMALSVIAYFISLLSRETALVFPVLLIAYEIFISGKKGFKSLIKPLLFLAVAAMFLVIRSKVLPVANPIQNQPIVLQGLALPFFPLLSKIIVKYFYIMLFPVNLHMWNIQDLVKSVIEKEFFLNIILLAAIIAAAIALVKRDRKAAFWLSWFIIFLLPHLPPVKLNAPFAEHWIIASSIGIYVIAASFIFAMISKFNATKWTAFVILSLIAIYLATLTVSRNVDWLDEPSIYNNTLKYGRYPNVLSNLGVYYEIRGEYDNSVKAHQEALAIVPNRPSYHNNIALVYLKMGRPDLAIGHWKRSLVLDPDQPRIRERLSSYGRI